MQILQPSHTGFPCRSIDLCRQNITEVGKDAAVLGNVTSSTTVIGLCDNNITKVDSKAFQEYDALQMLNFNGNRELRFPSDGSPFLISHSLMRLDCERCGISEIYKGSLEGMPNLKQINLRQSMIETLDDNAFQTNRALQEVDLSQNKLTRIPGGIFIGLQSLHSADFSSNSMLAPHEDEPFVISDSLKVLKCDECDFSVVYERTFSEVPQLEQLYLRNNSISEIGESALVSHKNLDTLMLQNNMLRRINLKLLTKPKLGLGGNAIKLDCVGTDRNFLEQLDGVECMVTTTRRFPEDEPETATNLITDTHAYTNSPSPLEIDEPKIVDSREKPVITEIVEAEIVIGISDWYITSYLTIIYLASSGVLVFLLCVLWKMEKYDSDPGVNFYAEGVLNPSPIYKPIQ